MIKFTGDLLFDFEKATTEIIAADKSMQWGHNGGMYGFATNRNLPDHYISCFGAEYPGMLHQYQSIIDEESAHKLLEVYHYEWNEA